MMASTYDLFLTPFLIGVRRKVIEIADSLHPDNVVDLCCGTGHQLKLMKKSGYENLTCVDLSENMLRVAAKGKYSPDCRLCDASNTGFDENSFDMALISLALHEKSKVKASAVLSEAHRILKPGAYLVVSDYSVNDDTPLYAINVIRFFEFLAGGEHWRNYKKYMKTGGLSQLHDQSLFKIDSRHSAAAGGISVEVWRKIKLKPA